MICRVSILFFQVIILCFLLACSPTFVALPPSKSSLPGISQNIFTSFDNTELPLRVWLPSEPAKAIIVALHGFNDYSNFIKDSASFFNDRNIALYSYDQRGFGQSNTRGRWSGWQLLADDLKTFTALVRQTYPDVPVFILGDSMGGAVTIVTMTRRDPPEVQGVILVAPAVWARSEMPLYQRATLWIAAHTIPWKKVTGQSLGVVASDNSEMLRELGKDPLVIKETRIEVLYGLSNLMDAAFRSAEQFRINSLILYGEKDEIIPRGPVLNFYERLPSKLQDGQKMILYKKGYHMLLRDLQSERVKDDIADWINEQTPL